jgi:hypothetical protein
MDHGQRPITAKAVKLSRPSKISQANKHKISQQWTVLEPQVRLHIRRQDTLGVNEATGEEVGATANDVVEVEEDVRLLSPIEPFLAGNNKLLQFRPSRKQAQILPGWELVWVLMRLSSCLASPSLRRKHAPSEAHPDQSPLQR